MGELMSLLSGPPGFRAQPEAAHSAWETFHDPPNWRPLPPAGILCHIFCPLLRSLCMRALTVPGTETGPTEGVWCVSGQSHTRSQQSSKASPRKRCQH